MNTQVTPEQNEPKEPPNIQPDDLTHVTPAVPAAGRIPPAQGFYIQEDDLPEEESNADGGISAQFARPFQLSTEIPVLQAEQDPGSDQPSFANAPKRAGGNTRSRFLKIAIVVTLVVAAMGFLWLTVFAQPVQPLTPPKGTATAPNQPTQAPRPTSAPKRPAGNPTPTAPGNAPAGNWVPQQLPAGWAGAGLTKGDAVFAERTAWTFADREEALDFRNVGTRAHHGGTLTASMFILSPGGRERFLQNDVRVVNNTLFDRVQNLQLVQAAVNATPNLVQFQTQDQNQFALVDVSFQLYQSQIDPAAGQRVDGLEMDPMTNQPRIHHMSVLLVRIKPETQGANAPAGGTGWLVSNYGLDQPNTNPVTVVAPA